MSLNSLIFQLIVLFVILCFSCQVQVQGQCVPIVMRIDGKVVIVTGGNSGIGKETATDLARRGGKVYLACRDLIKCENARDEIANLTSNANVNFLKLDLASIASIHEFSRQFHLLENKLHILINNAGVISNTKTYTIDGFESHIGVNHLGHFLLTNLLLDLIKAAQPSRIVVVASEMHFIGEINKNDLNSDNYYWIRAYSNSKLANILFANELSRRLTGTQVTVNSLHPGVVNTKVASSFNPVFNFFLTPVRNWLLKTPKAGAQTSIHLAVDPQYEGITGKYFIDCKEAYTAPQARSIETADWLWKISEEYTGIHHQQNASIFSNDVNIEV